MIVFGLLKTFGLRLIGGAFDAWIAQLGKVALAIGVLLAVAAWWPFNQRTGQVERAVIEAVADRDRIERENAEQAARDAMALAAEEAQLKAQREAATRVKDENNNNCSGVVWRSGDPWLRAKRSSNAR